MRKFTLAALLVLAGIAACGQTTKALFKPGTLRVLLLSGRNNHEWRETTPYLKKVLLSTGRFDVRVNEEPAGMSAATLAAYDVVVSDYCGPRWGELAEKALVDFVRSGKGLVIVHAADYTFGTMPVLGDHMTQAGFTEPPWTEYGDMVGAVWSAANPHTHHGKRHIFKVKFTTPDHPIAQGMGESFLADDELYFDFLMRPSAKILATAFNATEMGGSGKDEPILWTVDYGKGRVFHTALGHDVTGLREPGFKVSFARGTEWAATGAVTLPPKLEEQEFNADAVRALVVTGGHSYDPTFDGIFEGYPDIRATVDPHPGAFRRDLREKYDVLVLYDSVQELPAAGKKNLQDFVEAGKGVVVLHHAVIDFNDWPWWWRDVMGCRYLAKPDGDQPASKYLHDVDLIVQPVATHPILKGVGPQHFIEETYKDVWMSPTNLVLMKTDAPTADGPMAWISSYDKSRVFVTLMGHDRQVHITPGYRRLVHNAILWTAGRLK